MIQESMISDSWEIDLSFAKSMIQKKDEEIAALQFLVEEKEGQIQVFIAQMNDYSRQLSSLKEELEAAHYLLQEREGQITIQRAELADFNVRFLKHMEDHARLRGRHDKTCAELDQKRRDHLAMQALNEILVKDNLDLRQQVAALERAQAAQPILVTGGTPEKGESLCQEETKIVVFHSTPSTD